MITIDTIWSSGEKFYNLEQLLRIIKMSKKRFYGELNKVYKKQGYTIYKKMLDKNFLYIGKDTYFSIWGSPLSYGFILFEISRKMEQKKIKEVCKGVVVE